MNPNIWGKYGWTFIHMVTLGYPVEPTKQSKEDFYQFFHSISRVLPCEQCKNNMQTHLKRLPLTDEVLSSKNNLVKWGIDLHNVVNYYTGKAMLTYPEAINQISQLVEPPVAKNGSTLTVILVVIIIVIVMCWFQYKKLNSK